MTIASDAAPAPTETLSLQSGGLAHESVVAREAAHFGKLAADWWNPKGSSAMLHRLNPVRLAYLRQAIDTHWGTEASGFAPLTGRTALDVGCGAGLLAEPLARRAWTRRRRTSRRRASMPRAAACRSTTAPAGSRR
jgi:2-polyprenyl-6-hydroxyphenyl methylase/3-demethylubiquinone-9 3-methyltransferase